MSRLIRRNVSTSFWEDSKVVDKYTPEDKYFMLYLLTNPHTTQAGIYKLPYKIAAFELGYSVEATRALIDRFDAKYHVIRYSKATQEVAVLSSLKYSVVKGGKPVADCITSDLDQIEDVSLIVQVYQHLATWWDESARDFDHQVKKLFEAELKRRKVSKEVINDIDKDKDKDSIVATNRPTNRGTNRARASKAAPPIPYKEIINYLNKKTGAHYKPSSSANRKLIKARWDEGNSLEDFKKVIDNKAFSWQNSDMWKYMRPKTLFRASNFDDYLNENDLDKHQSKPTNGGYGGNSQPSDPSGGDFDDDLPF